MQKSWLQRLAWLIILWSGSVVTLAVVGYLFRLLMSAAGFKS